MTHLDYKLREILAETYRGDANFNALVDRIKQAFKDAGYSQGASHIYSNEGAKQLCMTSEEWHNHFGNEQIISERFTTINNKETT